MWKQGIDEVKGPIDAYKKKISATYNDLHDVEFVTSVFKKINGLKYKKSYDLLDGNDDDRFYLKDLENWHVIDIMKYNKKEL